MNLDFDRLAHAAREARAVRGWRQEDVADHAAVGVSSVQNMEKGRPFTRFPITYRKIAEALGWDEESPMAILRGGDPTPRQETSKEPVKRPDGPSSHASSTSTDKLPLKAQLALADGRTFDADVMEWKIAGEDFSVIVVAKAGKYDTLEKRQAAESQYELWARMKESMRRAAEAEVEGVEPHESH
jgi:transcriptional regulator with XRE-family HTH domain